MTCPCSSPALFWFFATRSSAAASALPGMSASITGIALKLLPLLLLHLVSAGRILPTTLVLINFLCTQADRSLSRRPTLFVRSPLQRLPFRRSLNPIYRLSNNRRTTRSFRTKKYRHPRRNTLSEIRAKHNNPVRFSSDESNPSVRLGEAVNSEVSLIDSLGAVDAVSTDAGASSRPASPRRG